VFREQQEAEAAIERIERVVGRPFEDLGRRPFTGCPDPDQALRRLENWLARTGNPATNWAHLADAPDLAQRLMVVLGASRPMADMLVQTPELAAVILEPGLERRLPTTSALMDEGKRLLALSTSFAHQLDRLRYLRQRWVLAIATCDLCDLWQQEQVWGALSDLATAIVCLTAEVVWTRHQPDKDFVCPVMVVAQGKLGGSELNYSSDIDLQFVAKDGSLEGPTPRLDEYCEGVARALSQRMGRGALYRVDLRLRPFGSAGPIVHEMGAVESYYRRYAEPWEHLALVRSHPICSDPELADRWERLRDEVAFPAARGEWFVQEALSLKIRGEEEASSADLKRAPGGIRDVELLTQILQVLHGGADATLRVRPTCAALRALMAAGRLTTDQGNDLLEAYTFLRRAEHRCQMAEDRQIHRLPAGDHEREVFARTCGFTTWLDFERALAHHRSRVRSHFERILGPPSAAGGHHQELRKRMGESAGAAIEWAASLPDPEAYLDCLVHNEGSRRRVERILVEAPRLLPDMKGSEVLADLVFSGEIEEPSDVPGRIQAIREAPSVAQCAALLGRFQTRELIRWVVRPDFDLNAQLTRAADAAVECLVGEDRQEIEFIALGSYGLCETGPASDLDGLFLATDPNSPAAAERHAERILADVGSMRRAGARIHLDLRLRPHGRRGSLARTRASFEAYVANDIESWERFALQWSRVVIGQPQTVDVPLHAAFEQPLTSETVSELLAMKARIEAERVSPWHRSRDVKLGVGGLEDLRWVVGLHLLKLRPSIEVARTFRTLPDRIEWLRDRGAISADEARTMLESRLHLLQTRNWLWLLGQEDSVVPENPDKLGRLASALGVGSGNDFLSMHERYRKQVRALFEAVAESLQ
jgi:glutamate-ammonia-ligase adenylyltransferase